MPEDEEDFVAGLNDGRYTVKDGDFSRLGSVFRKADRRQLVITFGLEFANTIIDKQPGKWFGPVQSRAGYHYVRILERHAPSSTPFEQLKDYLPQAWMFDTQRKAQQDKIDTMRAQFDVVLPEGYQTKED